MPHIKQSVRYLEIDINADGQRLFNYLQAHLSGVPKSHIFQIIRSGQVRVNSKRCRPHTRLCQGDRLRLPPVAINETAPVIVSDNMRSILQQSILFEDKNYLILDKPSAMAVHGGSGQTFGLIAALRSIREDKFLELAHRLDKDTSGCLVLARKRQALLQFQEQLKEHRVKKHYLLLVHGKWPRSLRYIETPLSKIGSKGDMGIMSGGKIAKTEYAVLNRFKQATLVQATILTGRTHQIRVQAQAAECAIIGDTRYGDRFKDKQFSLSGMCLHASSVKFCSPEGDTIAVDADMPDRMQQLIKQLVVQ